MKKINKPPIDDLQLLNDICSSYRPNIDPYKHNIIVRYNLYEQNFRNLENITSVETFLPIRKDLEESYERSSRFNEERKIILNHYNEQTSGLCLHCMMGKTHQLDHFFPKSEFPEYSIYSPNLIPICGDCNHKKGTVIFTDSERFFWNCYHDDFPDYRFLFFNFTLPPSGTQPKVELNLNFGGDTSEITQIIQRHFEKRRLKEIYLRDVVPGELSMIEGKIHECWKELLLLGIKDKIFDIIMVTLKSECSALMNKYGKNYWKACILEGMIRNAEFLNEFIERIISNDEKNGKKCIANWLEQEQTIINDKEKYGW